MTTLSMHLPVTVDPDEFEEEVVTAVADRLRDEHGFERSPGSTGSDETEHRYQLTPDGAIVVVRRQDRLTVRLRELDVDARDLFTGVSSELEQRHDGLAVEID
ncbi:hypothetical protein CIW49_08495 [Mycolicibacterium sp. P1-18]|uniref:hypothetical protein n=1 Tax=Mycolicibacterium sp. P1-18 TaxID=2024615 RepID=UPI0011F1530D|nr:hypothetical protein [Mycolicibacterium sp. P1-18]KAA0099625.1 hypothetical protein CIW49_08495 [Mycolicibacterium sp. P1-18]